MPPSKRAGKGQQNTKQNKKKNKKPAAPKVRDLVGRNKSLMLEAMALKRGVAIQVAELMRASKLNKSALAQDMRTSRAAIHRILNPKNPSLTLSTLNKAARALGRKLKIEFVPG
jgi:antitoxin HicB